MSDHSPPTAGPAYRPRPEEFRELQPPRIPLPYRNYQPGPERICLDSRAGTPRTLAGPAPASTATAVPMEALAHPLTRPASVARGSFVTRPKGVQSDSIAGRVLSVLAAATTWLSAHEIYLILREQGRCQPIDSFARINRGKDVTTAMAWHVTNGRVWARPTDRPEASAKKRGHNGVAEYRLGVYAVQEARR